MNVNTGGQGQREFHHVTPINYDNDVKGPIVGAKAKKSDDDLRAVVSQMSTREERDPESSRFRTRAKDFGLTIAGAFNHLNKHGKFPEGLQERYLAWRERPMTNDPFGNNFMQELNEYVNRCGTSKNHYRNLLDKALMNGNSSKYALAA